jgi:hypothetical protein
MKFVGKNFIYCLFVLGCFVAPLQTFADVCAKVDFAPAYVRVDVLESNETVKRMEMGAVRSDATITLIKDMGWVIKPTILYANGQGELLCTGVGIGHCTPITEWLMLTPSIGCLYTHLSTYIDIPTYGLKHQKEIFNSASPYLCLEATFTLRPGTRLCVSYQYAWSHTHTKIGKIVSSNSHADGPSYAAMLEYDIHEKWSLQLGAAYNISLSKEKHGLRGMGVKLGAARWF